MKAIERTELATVIGGNGAKNLAGIAERVWKWLGPGAKQVNTPKGARQFMSPGGDRKIRFDLTPEQHKGTGPHINLEQGPRNEHIPLSGGD